MTPSRFINFNSRHNWAAVRAELAAQVRRDLGLPFIRTSPDHGTAYDIAGKGIANPSSMIAAIRLAKQLALKARA